MYTNTNTKHKKHFSLIKTKSFSLKIGLLHAFTGNYGK